MEGSRWLTTYYQQVLDRDSELTAQSLHKSAPYQQYIKISDLELKVNSELSQTQTQESGEFEIQGSATMYPPVIPNVGDMFLADIGDGRAGVFAIVTSERRTILKQACFQVEYRLVDYDTETRLADLEAKTIQSTHFVKSFLEYGENPVIIESDYQTHRSLNELYSELISQYLGDFYSRRFETILVPDQPRITYDAFVVKTILAILDTTDHRMVQKIKNLNVNGLPEMDSPTIWDCLLELSDDMLPLVVRRVGLQTSKAFGTFPYYEGVYFSGIQDVVFPDEPRSDVDAPYEDCPSPKLLQPLIAGNPRHPLVPGVIPPEYVKDAEATGIHRLPDIHPVIRGNHYVFSQHFYNGIFDTTSKLEMLVMDALARRPVDLNVLAHLAQTAKDWASVERFYYVPALMILLKTNLREI